MDIKFSRVVCFDLPQSDKAVLRDAMVILDNCALDCRNQAELTEDSSLKAILVDCAGDFEIAASQIEEIFSTIKEGVQI